MAAITVDPKEVQKIEVDPNEVSKVGDEQVEPAASRFAKSFGYSLIAPLTSLFSKEVLENPLGMVGVMLEHNLKKAQDAYQAFKAGNPREGVASGLEAIPLAGQMAEAVSAPLAQGDVAGALGTAAGMAAIPKVVEAAPVVGGMASDVIRSIPEAVSPTAHPIARAAIKVFPKGPAVVDLMDKIRQAQGIVDAAETARREQPAAPGRISVPVPPQEVEVRQPPAPGRIVVPSRSAEAQVQQPPAPGRISIPTPSQEVEVQQPPAPGRISIPARSKEVLVQQPPAPGRISIPSKEEALIQQPPAPGRINVPSRAEVRRVQPPAPGRLVGLKQALEPEEEAAVTEVKAPPVEKGPEGPLSASTTPAASSGTVPASEFEHTFTQAPEGTTEAPAIKEHYQRAARTSKARILAKWLRVGGISVEDAEAMTPEHWKTVAESAGVNEPSKLSISQALYELKRMQAGEKAAKP